MCIIIEATTIVSRIYKDIRYRKSFRSTGIHSPNPGICIRTTKTAKIFTFGCIDPLEQLTTPDCEYLHTGQLLSFQLLKQEQRKACWQSIVSSPIVTSILSEHTGTLTILVKRGVDCGKRLVAKEAVDGRVIRG